MKRGLLVLGAMAAAAIAAGIATGAIPGGENGDVFSACYNKQSGELRVYDADPGATNPKPCNSKEHAISWNEKGDPGQDGVSGFERVTGDSIEITPGGGNVAYAGCPGNKVATGGGYRMAPNSELVDQMTETGVLVWRDSSSVDSAEWMVGAFNGTDASIWLRAYAICAEIAS